MDNSAIFYILDSDDDINYCTCKIIKKFYEEGKKILDSSGLEIISASDLSDAAQKIVKEIK